MEKMYNILLLCIISAVISCKSSTLERSAKEPFSGNFIEVQGHRGDRGNFPENSIPAFKSAVEKGVQVLELDVVISGDGKVVVSHEPFMSALYVLSPAGDPISKTEEREYNIYKMSYDSIRQYDAGSRGNALFPEQEKMKTYKPLLAEVVDTIEAYIATKETGAVKYNIELKSKEPDYDLYQPSPQEFVDLVMAVVKEKRIQNKANIQSFDTNILNAVNAAYPEMETAYLVTEEGILQNLALLHYKPEIYSPHFKLVKNRSFVDSIQSLNMRLIPWTVNEEEDILEMMRLQVDGIITDYPERVMEKFKL